MATGVVCGLQNRHGAFTRPGWVRFPHVPATSTTIVLVIAAVASLPSATRAQDPSLPTSDSLAAPPGDAVAQVAAPVARDTTPPVSPLGALVRSLVLPGWGQTAVGRPERGAVYFAAEAASLFMVFKSQAKLSAARRADPVNEGLVEARVSDRENWIVLAAFVAFLSSLDAWVSAQFWDFEPSVRPPDDGSPGAAVSVALPVRFP